MIDVENCRNMLRESWSSAYGGTRNAGRVAILEEGLKFTPISISPQDSQLLETRKFSVEEICRIFRVPPHLVQDLSRSTFNNIENQGSGVYFIDKLPYGTYYLYEEKAPSGYTAGKWFTLTVSNDNTNGSRDGVTVAEITDAAHITELQNFVKP